MAHFFLIRVGSPSSGSGQARQKSLFLWLEAGGKGAESGGCCGVFEKNGAKESILHNLKL